VFVQQLSPGLIWPDIDAETVSSDAEPLCTVWFKLGNKSYRLGRADLVLLLLINPGLPDSG